MGADWYEFGTCLFVGSLIVDSKKRILELLKATPSSIISFTRDTDGNYHVALVATVTEVGRISVVGPYEIESHDCDLRECADHLKPVMFDQWAKTLADECVRIGLKIENPCYFSLSHSYCYSDDWHCLFDYRGLPSDDEDDEDEDDPDHDD